MRNKSMKIIFLFCGLILFLIISLPILKLIVVSDRRAFLLTLQDLEVIKAIVISFTAGIFSTLIGLTLGIPLAYSIVRYEFLGKKIVESIINLPLVIPHPAAGIALLYIFGQRYIGGKLFHWIGIEFTGSILGITIAMCFVSVPILVNSVKDGLKGIDRRIINVARTLGASPWTIFTTIELPLIYRNILSGMIMMWARGISEFGAVLVIAYYPMTAPVLLMDRFNTYGLTYALPIAGILILVCIVVFFMTHLIGTEKSKLVL